jgi:hypothetical protein
MSEEACRPPEKLRGWGANARRGAGYGSKFNLNHDEQNDVEERLISLKLTHIGQCGAAFRIRNITDNGRGTAPGGFIPELSPSVISKY